MKNRQQFQLLFDFQSSCCSHRVDEDEDVGCRKFPPVSLKDKTSILFEDRLDHFFKSFELLVSSLTCPLYRMNRRRISLWSLFHMFITQSSYFSFCFNEIQKLIQWSLNTFCVQRKYPNCRFECIPLVLHFQCKFVILNTLLISPLKIWQKLSVFVIIVTSMQNIFLNTTVVLPGFLQHFIWLVIHALPQTCSMSGSVGWFFFDNVPIDKTT